MTRYVLLTLLLASHGARAQADKCTKAVAVATPCIGTLMPSEGAKAAVLCLKRDLPNCTAAADHLRAVCDATAFELSSKLRTCREQKSELSARLADSSDPVKQGYSGWELAGVGVLAAVVGAAVGLLVGSAISD